MMGALKSIVPGRELSSLRHWLHITLIQQKDNYEGPIIVLIVFFNDIVYIIMHVHSC